MIRATIFNIVSAFKRKHFIQMLIVLHFTVHNMFFLIFCWYSITMVLINSSIIFEHFILSLTRRRPLAGVNE